MLHTQPASGLAGTLRRCACRAGRVLLVALLALCASLAPAGPTHAAAATEVPVDETGRAVATLRGGWYLWDPYQFIDKSGAAPVLTGLDVENTRAVAREAGYSVAYSYRPWQQHIAQMREGTADIAAGMTKTPEREAFLHFSRPYRQETNVLYVPAGQSAQLPFASVEAMVAHFRDTGFRLGVVQGFAYADPAINAYIADPRNAERIVSVQSEYENLRNLVDGRIDGLLADRLVAATSAWRGGFRSRVEEHPLRLSVDIHFGFSKRTVPPEVVARFDEAITRLESSGEARRISASYLAPVLLAQTIDRPWFLALDILGTVAFALSGVLIAARERYSLLGALVLAALPAVGGGAMRDLLVGREPVAMLANPLYLTLVAATVLVGFVFMRMPWATRRYQALRDDATKVPGKRLLGNLFEVSDAVGIAAFTVTGVAVAVSHRTEPLWLWGPLLATLTAAGGGILRDIVRQSGDIASLRTQFYAEVPLLWGLLLGLYLAWQAPNLDPDRFAWAVVVTLAGAFATRMAVVALGITSPRFSPDRG